MHQIQAYQPFETFTLNADVQLARRVTGLFGPSGSGKTTLLNCIAGLQRPQRGLIQVGHTVLFQRNGDGHDSVNVAVRDRRIGYVFQDPLLFAHMTVCQNLRFARRAGSGPLFDDVVSILELAPLLERRARTLSGGEQRRVAIGRALLSAPRLLLLDEPLTGLDRRLAGKTLSYVRAVLDAFHLPAIYVSHLVSDVMFLCDDVVILDHGSVTAHGPPAELLAQMESADPAHRPALKNIFTLPVRTVDADAGTVSCTLGDQVLIMAGLVARGAERATALVPARDIILATAPPVGVSARNVLRGRIERIESVGAHRVVFVDVGVSWMVEVTAGAVRELNLQPDETVYVVAKASSIQIVDTRT